MLVQYLPGLDPGLLPLSTTRGLLAGAALRPLVKEYGSAGVEGIFQAAGVTERRPVSDKVALELVQQRDIAALPPRTPAPDSRLWHLDEVEMRGAWDLLGGAGSIDWTGVKVGQVDTGYTRHKSLGFLDASWLDVAAGRAMFAGAGPGRPGPGGGGDIGVSVINLSMGFLPRIVQRDLKRAIDETYEAGAILVCAAGQPLAQVVSPAHGRRTIAVAGSAPGSNGSHAPSAAGKLRRRKPQHRGAAARPAARRRQPDPGSRGADRPVLTATGRLEARAPRAGIETNRGDSDFLQALWEPSVGQKARTEAERIATPKPRPIPGTNLKKAGGQRISKERGSHTRNKKNAGKRAHQGGS